VGFGFSRRGFGKLEHAKRICLRTGKWLDDKSRMNREVYVRFREGLGVKFPGSTLSILSYNFDSAQTTSEVQQLDRAKQRDSIKHMRSDKIPTRQMARITGLSKGVVEPSPYGAPLNWSATC
jgi:hypothetical protein